MLYFKNGRLPVPRLSFDLLWSCELVPDPGRCPGHLWRGGVGEPQACLLPAGHLGFRREPSPRQHLSASGRVLAHLGGSFQGPEWSVAAAPPPVGLCGVELSPGWRAPVTQACWCGQGPGQHGDPRARGTEPVRSHVCFCWDLLSQSH